MNLILPLLCTFISASTIQFALWRRSVRESNAGWVDLGWTLGMWFGGLFLLGFNLGSARAIAISLVFLFWSGRLAAHIYRDRLRGGKAEDGRYSALRAHWGAKANQKFFFLFQSQALLSALFLLPAVAVIARPGAFPDFFDGLGMLIALGAILGERSADQQLARFRGDPENKGKVCQEGFWRYSRHPNYFFEFLHWTSYTVWAWGSDLYLFTWLGAVLMYIFLRYLTGIPHTERQSLKSRGEAYALYQKTTSPFFPWIPRKLS